MFSQISTQLTPTVRRLLKETHTAYGTYYRVFLHNHLVHGLISLVALQRSDAEIEKHYYSQAQLLEKPTPRLLQITETNWESHLDEGFRAAPDFVNFFDHVVSRIGFQSCLKKFVLHPKLASRLVAGAVHGLIHLGYACELAEKEPDAACDLLSETLAMVCTTRDQFRQIVDMLPSLSMEHGNFEGNIVLSIIEAMEKETKLYEIPPRDHPDKLDYVIAHTDVMKPFYAKFEIEPSHASITERLKELYVAATVIVFASVVDYRAPRVDFFLVHLLTSCFALVQVLPSIELSVALILCRLHFIATLAWYRARASPTLCVHALLQESTPLSWIDVENLYAQPDMEVHAVKAVRALKFGQELCVQESLEQMLPETKGKNFWLICANVLAKSIPEEQDMEIWMQKGVMVGKTGSPLWLQEEAWDYYKPTS